MSTLITSITDLDKYIDQLKNIKVWICSTACGKSYLAANDTRFFDLDAYRTQLRYEGFADFEDRTIPKMYEIIKQGKIVLNASHGHILNYLDKNKVPFVFMYARPECQNEYIQRMANRGNGKEFIQKYGTIIASLYKTNSLDNRATFKIEMKNNEYVSDYLWKVFGKV